MTEPANPEPAPYASSDIPVIQRLRASEAPRSRICRFWLNLTTDCLGRPINVPVIVARGGEAGPTVGITAALHGNELNGFMTVRKLFQQLDATALTGTVIGVLVANVPAFHDNRREFPDGTDLNRIMPGERGGNDSQVYAHRLIDRLGLDQLDYLLDLHTASAGRVNSYYVRANMSQARVATLARLQSAEIILHDAGGEHTLRAVAAKFGVAAITVEINDPHVYQEEKVDVALDGVMNTLIHLKMIEGSLTPPAAPAVECERSYWLYTDQGGILEVLPELAAPVATGERIAILTNVFGDIVRTYAAPDDGVVIGKSINPVNHTGGRILHLGIPKQEKSARAIY